MKVTLFIQKNGGSTHSDIATTTTVQYPIRYVDHTRLELEPGLQFINQISTGRQARNNTSQYNKDILPACNLLSSRGQELGDKASLCPRPSLSLNMTGMGGPDSEQLKEIGSRQIERDSGSLRALNNSSLLPVLVQLPMRELVPSCQHRNKKAILQHEGYALLSMP